MFVIKCNFCGKQIKGSPIVAGRDYTNRADLCEQCGKPVLDFLKKRKFVKENSRPSISSKKKK